MERREGGRGGYRLTRLPLAAELVEAGLLPWLIDGVEDMLGLMVAERFAMVCGGLLWRVKQGC